MTKYQIKFLYLFYFILFLTSFFIFKDFGLGIEENFQRASGFYWLKQITGFFNLEYITSIADSKYNQLYGANSNLPKANEYNSYGVVFDLPTAILEIILNFKNSANNIYLRHFFSFFIFLVSGISFTAILIKRFHNSSTIIFGTLTYLLTPKIFGASFFDGKDLFFLSIFTISLYFYIKFENKKNFFNLILFSFFCALATSSRIFGLIIPITFISIYALLILNNFKNKENYRTILIFLFFFIFFLFLSWPYLWGNLSTGTFSGFNLKVFFNGEFYNNKTLPISYIPKLILITTPSYLIIFFLVGFFLILKRFFKRTSNITDSSKQPYQDFWRGENEKIDIFFLFSFIQIIIIYLSINGNLYSSWRHFFFIHFFLVYFFSYCCDFFFIHFKKNNKILLALKFVLSLFVIEIIYKLYLYHPYQYLYFNNFISKENKLKFEIDTPHLSRADALKYIISDAKNKETIFVGTASFSPLGDVRFLLNENDNKKIILLGVDDLSKSDYIYTNYIYEINTNYNTKYQIPANFYLYKTLTKDNTLIYSIYKKK